MKKSFIIFGLAAGALMLASCQKELTEGNAGASVPQVTKTMYVEGNEWIPEDGTKTAYQPGQGVQWTGTETFAIYYGNSANAGGASGKYMAGKAGNVASSGSGLYTFTHDAIDGAETYDYCVIVPDLNTTGINTTGVAASFKLSPVQTPGADTYDPNYDILLGQGAQQVSVETELEITSFKRLTAPLRLTITDGAGILGNEKIYAVTLRFNQAIEKDKGMAGTGYLNFAYEYDACKVNSIAASSNTVTAVYAEGLQKSGEGWPVWYSVYPFASTGDMTVTVTTETKTLVRTIPAAGASILANQLNGLTFDISGSGFTESESLYWDFTALDEIAPQQVASDGKSYNWGFANCTVWNGGDATGQLPSSLRANADGGEITLPTIAGKQITKIRLYAHPNNAQNAQNTITLNAGTAHAFSSYADNDETLNSGVLEITVPETEYGQPLVLKAGAALAAFDGIAVELTDAELEPADENDYYDLFTKGYTIVINGKEYNNANYPVTPRLYTVDQLLELDNQVSIIQGDAVTSGILFIEASETDAILETAAMAPGTAQEVVIIGRHKNHQPKIRFTACSIRCDFVLKNLDLSTTRSDYLFRTNWSGYDNQLIDIVVEDSSVDLTTTQYLFYDQANEYSFNSVVLNNSIVKYGAGSNAVFGFRVNDAKTAYGPTDVTVTNSVIYSENTIEKLIVNLGNASSAFEANLNVSGNTFYNIRRNSGLIVGNNIGNFVVDGNCASYLFDDSVTTTSSLFQVFGSAETSSISNNYLYTDAETSKQWNINHPNSKVTAGENNIRNTEGRPFISEDVAQGYFPIDESVVTNGAGADYDTKYWVQK